MKSSIRVGMTILYSCSSFAVAIDSHAVDFSSSIACQIQISDDSSGLQVGNKVYYRLAAVTKLPLTKLIVNGEVRDFEEPSTFLLTDGSVGFD